VFGAAAAVLILEILALRMLAPYVGLTLETSTTVIGVVLAGIAAGSALGGALADRVDPRAILASALIAGGLLAMLTVPLVRVLGDAAEGGGEAGALMIALVAFFPPAAVLSTITPATAKNQLASLANTGAVVGRLSAWATAGALVGTFSAGFVLVPLLPTSGTVLALGGLLVLAGIAGAVHVRLLRRRGPLVVLLAALAALAPALALDERCDAESEYYCAQVRIDGTRPSGRILVLDDVSHSYVDLEDPAHLGFAYTRWIARSLDTLPAADGRFRAVFIGGGGLTLPRYLVHRRPRAQARVLEVDRKLIELGRERLGFRDHPSIQIRTGDARLTLRDEPTASADVVVGDAFGGRAVPWHLTTTEFLAEVRRVLRPGGVYAMNLIDFQPLKFVRAEAATLLAGFRDVALVTEASLTGIPRGGNVVLFASERALPVSALPSGNELLRLDTDGVRELAGDSDTLTDEHAPADQLLSARP
jgi:spermidine synthase